MGAAKLIAPYLALIRAFVAGEVGTNEFEGQYLQMFKSDETVRPRRIFRVLDHLFADVDAFVIEDDLREEGDLDEQGLLAAARRALDDLEAFESSGRL